MDSRMKRIAFVIESDYNAGGMERILATIANRLTEWYDITVITAFNEGRPAFFPIKENIKQHDLGIKGSHYSSARQLKRVYRDFLETYLLSHRQEVCISLGSLEYSFLPRIKDGSKKMLWFHFALNYDLMTTRICSLGIVNTIVGRLRQLKRLLCARHYDHVVVLSKADARQWRWVISNVSVIYNPVTIIPQTVADYSVKRAIAVGRLDRQKGFDELIRAWRLVQEHCPDWKLDIYGDGPQREELQYLVADCGLQDVVFLRGRTDDVAATYACHSLYVMSSRYEGFPLVLVEACTCGLPLVSFDCHQGPAEIITPGIGILVRPVGDVKALATAVCELTENEKLRRTMGQRAKELAKRFNLDDIAVQWRAIISAG